MAKKRANGEVASASGRMTAGRAGTRQDTTDDRKTIYKNVLGTT